MPNWITGKDGDKAWKKATDIVTKEYGASVKDSDPDKFYSLVTTVYKNVCKSPDFDCGIKESRTVTPMPGWMQRQFDHNEEIIDGWSPAKQEWAGRLPKLAEDLGEFLGVTNDSNECKVEDMKNLIEKKTEESNEEAVARLMKELSALGVKKITQDRDELSISSGENEAFLTVKNGKARLNMTVVKKVSLSAKEIASALKKVGIVK